MPKIRGLIAFAMLTAASSAAHADALGQAVQADMPMLVALYRDLHAHPELSLHEEKTAARLAREIRPLGFRVTGGVGGTGLVAVMENGSGPTVMLRTDMDALPVAEQTGLAYASKAMGIGRDGRETAVMHACGHDIHMAAWVGAARRLAALKDRWRGTLVMIAQPAEELGFGAGAMLDDGLFTRFPRPDAVIAFHDAANLPAGHIGYSPAHAFANVDWVEIVVKGIGGHGAYPQTTKDPIVLAARIVTALQTLVSREVDPQNPAVVTVGTFHAGTKPNVIPDEARLQLTVRSYDDETRKLLLDGIARIARGEAIAAGMPDDRMPVVTVEQQYTPAAVNTQPLTGRLVQAFTARFGKDRVVEIPPTMAGEDFSRYHRADPNVQSMIFWVGGVPQAKWDAAKGDPARLPSLHSPFWAPDPEPTIGVAVEALVTAALTVTAN